MTLINKKDIPINSIFAEYYHNIDRSIKIIIIYIAHDNTDIEILYDWHIVAGGSVIATDGTTLNSIDALYNTICETTGCKYHRFLLDDEECDMIAMSII